MATERYDKNNRKVVLTESDVNIIEDFYSSFKIPMHAQLRAQVDSLKEKIGNGTYTVEDQNKLRAALAYSVLNTKHQILESDIFTQNIKDTCAAELYEVQFELDINDLIQEENKG